MLLKLAACINRRLVAIWLCVSVLFSLIIHIYFSYRWIADRNASDWSLSFRVDCSNHNLFESLTTKPVISPVQLASIKGNHYKLGDDALFISIDHLYEGNNTIIDFYQKFDSFKERLRSIHGQNQRIYLIYYKNSTANIGNELLEINNFLIQRHLSITAKIALPCSLQVTSCQDSFLKVLSQQALTSIPSCKGKNIAHQISFSLLHRCFNIVANRQYNKSLLNDCLPIDKYGIDKVAVYPILITGLGGVGSHFVNQVLEEQLGLTIHHERIDYCFPYDQPALISLQCHGAVSWFYGINDISLGKDYPFGVIPNSKYKNAISPRFQRVVHLIRNPLDHISAFTSHTAASYSFLFEFLVKYCKYRIQIQNNGGYKRVIDSRKSTQDGDLNYEQMLEKLYKARKNQHNCERTASCHLYFAAISWVLYNDFIGSYTTLRYRIEDEVGSLVYDTCSYLQNNQTKFEILHHPLRVEDIDCERLLSMNFTKSNYQSRENTKLQWVKLYRSFKKKFNSMFVITKKRRQNLITRYLDKNVNARYHLKYSLVNISRIDHELAEVIYLRGMSYGYQLRRDY